MSLDQKGLLPLWVDASSHMYPALRTGRLPAGQARGQASSSGSCAGVDVCLGAGWGDAQLVSPESPSTLSGSTSVLWNVLPLVGTLSVDPPILCQNSLLGAWEARAHAQYLVPGAQASARLPERRRPPTGAIWGPQLRRQRGWPGRPGLALSLPEDRPGVPGLPWPSVEAILGVSWRVAPASISASVPTGRFPEAASLLPSGTPFILDQGQP